MSAARSRLSMRTIGLALLVLALAASAIAHADPAPALFGASDDGSDPPAVERKVKAELALAKKGKPRTIMLAVNATDEWGCECLPFVFAPYASSAPDGLSTFVFPVVTAGADPAAVTVGSSAGTYELTGHFTKERITEKAWLARRKVKRGGDKRTKAPVFVVDSWCFRKAAEVPDYDEPVLADMHEAGAAFCP